jgi:hypothetical protein
MAEAKEQLEEERQASVGLDPELDSHHFCLILLAQRFLILLMQP